MQLFPLDIPDVTVRASPVRDGLQQPRWIQYDRPRRTAKGLDMTDHLDHNGHSWNTRAKFVFLVFAAIAAFLLISEHRAHLLPYLPWLILLACPLMHVFHHGHGGHTSQSDTGRREDGSSSVPPSPRDESRSGVRADPPGGHEHHGGS